MSRTLTTKNENHRPHPHETRHPRLVISVQAGIQADIPAPNFHWAEVCIVIQGGNPVKPLLGLASLDPSYHGCVFSQTRLKQRREF
jgi:hypothetical protein